MRPQIERLFAEFSGQGLRTLGVAYRDMGSEAGIHKAHESGMTFLSLLVLDDALGPESPGSGRQKATPQSSRPVQSG